MSPFIHLVSAANEENVYAINVDEIAAMTEYARPGYSGVRRTIVHLKNGDQFDCKAALGKIFALMAEAVGEE